MTLCLRSFRRGTGDTLSYPLHRECRRISQDHSRCIESWAVQCPGTCPESRRCMHQGRNRLCSGCTCQSRNRCSWPKPQCCRDLPRIRYSWKAQHYRRRNLLRKQCSSQAECLRAGIVQLCTRCSQSADPLSDRLCRPGTGGTKMPSLRPSERCICRRRSRCSSCTVQRRKNIMRARQCLMRLRE